MLVVFHFNNILSVTEKKTPRRSSARASGDFVKGATDMHVRGCGGRKSPSGARGQSPEAEDILRISVTRMSFGVKSKAFAMHKL